MLAIYLFTELSGLICLMNYSSGCRMKLIRQSDLDDQSDKDIHNCYTSESIIIVVTDLIIIHYFTYFLVNSSRNRSSDIC